MQGCDSCLKDADDGNSCSCRCRSRRTQAEGMGLPTTPSRWLGSKAEDYSSNGLYDIGTAQRLQTARVCSSSLGCRCSVSDIQTGSRSKYVTVNRSANFFRETAPSHRYCDVSTFQSDRYWREADIALVSCRGYELSRLEFNRRHAHEQPDQCDN